MNIGQSSERFMGMSEVVWQRHANPISGWSRVPVLPLLAMATWGRVWFGWWALVPIGLIFIWIWINPRIFPVPKSTNNWMSKGVLGERVWLNRKTIPIPPHHAKMVTLLNSLAGAGIIPFALGLFYLNIGATVSGVLVMMLAKLWFLDRMAWLFGDMRRTEEEYESWLR